MKILDLTGMRFGRLVAMVKLPSLKPGDGFRWECVCDCGRSSIVKARLLTYKKGTRSCGCILAEKNRLRPIRRSTNLKHGHTVKERHTPEYICWSSMIQRCTNPKHSSYKYYGGRGVTVCERWLWSFENFLEDMGERPAKKSLDRVDANAGYSKENCRWATIIEQARNKRKSVRIMISGSSYSSGEVIEKFSIPSSTLFRWVRLHGADISDQVNSYRPQAKRHAKESPLQ